MNRRTFLYLFASILLVASISCRFFHSTDGESINIGTILGLTGEDAAYGKQMQKGFEFALDEINSSGGVNSKKINLVVEDSQFNAPKAVSAYRKLTGAQGIKIFVGITGSKNALPVCQAARSEDVVIIDALTSAPKITQECGDNYFRIMASDALAGQYNTDWAIESGMKKPMIIYIEDDWGTSYRDALLLYLKQKGFGDVPAQGLTANNRDFRIQVEKVKASAPDSIFLLLYAKDGASFMQQLRQAGVKAVVYGSDNISSSEFLSAGSEVVEGVRVALPAPVTGPAFDEFTNKFKSKFGEAPDANVIKSYDAMNLAVSVIRQVGTEPSKIKSFLHSPSFQYQGVSGLIKFDEHGDLIHQEYSRLIYQSGQLLPANR